MKFRYISISLGVGRYRPHSAEEVLANQYGDCKDKHTLFAALLKAEGIEAWPALIGAGLKFNADVPSPAAFNHVITVLRQSGQYVWLDTTAEVAPYGLINQAIRDEQALIVPASGKAFLQKTPMDPPFAVSNSMSVTAALSADGTLNGHFDLQLDGDTALTLRAAFRQLAPAQWQTGVQQMSYGLGFAGDVSTVEVEDLENIEKPFHCSYDYNRKNYSDWAEHKITFPLLPLDFGPGPEAESPKEPFWAREPGIASYRASIHLPSGFTPDIPSDVSLKTDFADYSAHYSFKDATFACERKMTVKRSKVALDQWAAYQRFIKGVQTDQNTVISLSEAPPDVNNPAAEALVNRAMQALQMHKAPEARDLLAQAEKLNPKQLRLWSMYAYVAFSSGQKDEGFTDARKEIELHPGEAEGYGELATLLLQAGRRDEAIDAWRKALQLWPENDGIATQLVTLLTQRKRYAEIAPALEKSIAVAPANYHLRVLSVLGFLGTGDNAHALADAQEIAKATTDPLVLNDLAYYLTDAGVTTPSPVEWVQRAISLTEQECAKTTLTGLEQKDVANVNGLAAEWDTLGWIYFKQGDLAKAEKYVDAAWRLNQQGDVADHLGQVYEKQGKQAQAIHMWRLALAAQSSNEDARERLQKAGTPIARPITRSASLKERPVSAGEELGRLRTVKVPGLPKDTPVADYFVVVSRQGVQEVEIAADADAPKGVKEALRAASFDFVFPDDGTERIVRRGILSCSAYTNPNCQFTMLPLSNTNIAGMRTSGAQANDSSPAGVVPPTVISKVEPEYSDLARKAGLEGTVLLKIVINEEGIPQDVAVVKSLGMGLDESAKACVVKWRFKAAMRNGKPFKAAAQVEVNFKLLKGGQ
jgi:TonB family protein